MIAASVLAASPLAARAQVIRDSASAASTSGESSAPALTYADLNIAKQAQADFELFRIEHLPPVSGTLLSLPIHPARLGSGPPDPPGYRNQVKGLPIPAEPAIIAIHRDSLIAMLDALAERNPTDTWAAEQRVRYLDEAGSSVRTLAAARDCHGSKWLCHALVGFSLHALGRYGEADSAFALALANMAPSQRCEWRSVGRLIDDDAQRDYGALACGDPQRDAYEDRLWYLSRVLYSRDADDPRTELYARRTMAVMVHDAPNVMTSQAIRAHYDSRFTAPVPRAIDLIIRYGWPRAWEFTFSKTFTPLVGGFTSTESFGLMPSGPVPTYRYVPPNSALSDPTRSDSAAWGELRPALYAGYAPPYAKSLTPLAHQAAMFRRGDSALVVMAYDARTPELAGGSLTAALVLVADPPAKSYRSIASAAPDTGVLFVRAPWGRVLLSGEVYAPDKQAVARARYGLQPWLAPGARVTLSDLLLFKGYGALPTSVETAAHHALLSARVMANEKLGVYWESYGTDPAGEPIRISLTVTPEEIVPRSRILKILGLEKDVKPVVVSTEDHSALGANVTPRALEVDISTLPKGIYTVRLEAEAAGQYAVRSERRITVIGP